MNLKEGDVVTLKTLDEIKELPNYIGEDHFGDLEFVDVLGYRFYVVEDMFDTFGKDVKVCWIESDSHSFDSDWVYLIEFIAKINGKVVD